MNVTVLLARPLRYAVDGRSQLELGFPATTGIGEVVETLLALYPKLWSEVMDERSAEGGLQFWLGEWMDRGRRIFLLAVPSGALPERS